MKALYSENWKTAMRETEDDANKRRDVLCWGPEECCRNSQRIRRNSYPNTDGISHRARISDLQFVRKHKRPPAKAVLRKRTKLEESQSLVSYTRSLITPTVWYWHKNRHTEQCGRTELRTQAILLWLLYRRRRTQAHATGKRQSFRSRSGKPDSHMRKNETRLLSYTRQRNEFKMDKDLHVKPETIKLLE